MNIFCIGRNYADHAKELGNALPTAPVVFLKPTSSLIETAGTILLPAGVGRVDHEIEILLEIGAPGKNLSEEASLSVISKIGVGLDLTARELQAQAKEKGLPWSVAKGYDTFAVRGALVPFSQSSFNLSQLEFELEINGERRQRGNSSDMLYSIPTIVSYLSRVFTLSKGDLIFTGTPAGVGPLQSGDRLIGRFMGQAMLQASVQNGY